jgi:hypothetical protein
MHQPKECPRRNQKKKRMRIEYMNQTGLWVDFRGLILKFSCWNGGGGGVWGGADCSCNIFVHCIFIICRKRKVICNQRFFKPPMLSIAFSCTPVESNKTNYLPYHFETSNNDNYQHDLHLWNYYMSKLLNTSEFIIRDL